MSLAASGCTSGTVKTPAAPQQPLLKLSEQLNDSSVFVGASIIQFWPMPVHNAGGAGQTTSQVLARFQAAVTGHGYVRVILLCGTNDVVQGLPDLARAITDNLRAMDQIAKDAGLQVVLGELPPATSGGVVYDSTMAKIDASIAQLANERHDVVVDFYTPMLGHPEYFNDGVHPNAAGYAVMESAVAAAVTN
jgi:lysophospholipase L1-like esterase